MESAGHIIMILKLRPPDYLVCVQAQAKEQAGDLVVTVAVDTAAADAALASLQAALGPDGSLAAAMGNAGVHVVPDSLRVLPPASEE